MNLPFIIEYLLKVSIALAIVYMFYMMLLRRLTFYNWNRWYLLGYSLLCFLIPFLNVTDFLFQHQLQQSQIVQLIPSITPVVLLPTVEHTTSPGQIMLYLLATGMMIMLVRVVLQLISLKRMQSKAILLNEGGVKLYHVDASIVPFSFHDAIYINHALHTESELQEIIRHEFVHVKQKHSLDILIAELLCIVLWFNPVVWLLRKAIRQNLEFIADHQVLEDGIDKKQYQYLLLKVVGNSQFSIAPKFNFSSLKNRIAMMNQIKSARVQVLRFLFVLPLIAVLVLSFREVKRQQHSNQDFTTSFVLQRDTIPAEQIATIDVIKANGKNSIKIVLKDGTVDNYNLNDEAQKKAFEKKYGQLNPPPPPPPPSSGKNKWVMINKEQIATINITKSNGRNLVQIKLKNGTEESYDLDDPKQKEALEQKYGAAMSTPVLPPSPPDPKDNPASISPVDPPSVPNKYGYYLSIADNNGECVVLVKDRNKKIVQAMTLTDWNKNEVANQKKYGEIPPPPPPKPKVAMAPTVKITGVQSPVVAIAEVPAVGVTVAPLPNATVVEVPVVGVTVAPVPAVEANPKNLQTTKGMDIVLYIVDGKELSKEEVDKINPNTIESIDILKGTSATKLYGEKGKNGVIIIKTKIKSAAANLQIMDKISVEPI